MTEKTLQGFKILQGVIDISYEKRCLDHLNKRIRINETYLCII